MSLTPPFDEFSLLLEKKSVQNVGLFNCTMWTGATDTSRSYGRQRVKWPGIGMKIELVHRLNYMIHNKLTPSSIPTEDEDGNKLEISHLCHNSLCLNISHLVLEPHSINMERFHCKVQHLCSGSHNPPCLLN